MVDAQQKDAQPEDPTFLTQDLALAMAPTPGEIQEWPIDTGNDHPETGKPVILLVKIKVPSQQKRDEARRVVAKESDGPNEDDALDHILDLIVSSPRAIVDRSVRSTLTDPFRATLKLRILRFFGVTGDFLREQARMTGSVSAMKSSSLSQPDDSEPRSGTSSAGSDRVNSANQTSSGSVGTTPAGTSSPASSRSRTTPSSPPTSSSSGRSGSTSPTREGSTGKMEEGKELEEPA